MIHKNARVLPAFVSLHLWKDDYRVASIPAVCPPMQKKERRLGALAFSDCVSVSLWRLVLRGEDASCAWCRSSSRSHRYRLLPQWCSWSCWSRSPSQCPRSSHRYPYPSPTRSQWWCRRLFRCVCSIPLYPASDRLRPFDLLQCPGHSDRPHPYPLVNLWRRRCLKVQETCNPPSTSK